MILTGRTKLLTLIYENGGGYITKLDTNIELLSTLPLSYYGLSVSTKQCTIASGIGENAGYTILGGVYSTTGKKLLHEVLQAIRIDEKLFAFHHYTINQRLKTNQGAVLKYTFVMEEIYKSGARKAKSTNK